VLGVVADTGTGPGEHGTFQIAGSLGSGLQWKVRYKRSVMKALDTLEKKVGRFCKGLITVRCFVLPIVMFLNITNIAGRYFFRAPVKSTYELTGFFVLVLLAWAD